jgi:hypothetical protein
MKTALAALLLLCALPATAQEETLLGAGPIEHGGYGALVIKFSQVSDQFAVLVGARGGWILNHTFSIGLAGYGLVNEIPVRSQAWAFNPYLNFGYGGLDLEYILNSNAMVHSSVHLLIGGGAVGRRSANWVDYAYGYSGNEWDYHPFFVLEPGANLDLNMTSWFRMSFGAAYRIAGPVKSDLASKSDLSGASGMLTFRFGSF